MLESHDGVVTPPLAPFVDQLPSRHACSKLSATALSRPHVVAVVVALGGFLVAGALWISHLANGWWFALGALGGYAVGVTLVWGSEPDYRGLCRSRGWVRFNALPGD